MGLNTSLYLCSVYTPARQIPKPQLEKHVVFLRERKKLARKH